MSSFKNGYLPLRGDEHKVYWEAEDGEGKIPVLVLHGGWGPLGHDGRFLDRARFYRVYLHQRGWGSSTPRGERHQDSYSNLLQAALSATMYPQSWKTLRH